MRPGELVAFDADMVWITCEVRRALAVGDTEVKRLLA